MIYVYPILFGITASLLGFIAPTMLSMTAARTSVEQGKKAGFYFAAGAVTIIFIQANIAVFFSQYLLENPEVIIFLKKAAIFILLGLAAFFLLEARKALEINVKDKAGHSYLVGITMAALNQLAIPFYLTMATVAEGNSWIIFNHVISFFYAMGAVIGAFAIFSTYVIFAEFISHKYQFISKNINYILSGVFIFLSAINAVQIFV